jgi:hypothetical protein
MSNLHTKIRAAFVAALFTPETSRFRPVGEEKTFVVDRVTLEVTKHNQINIITVDGRTISIGGGTISIGTPVFSLQSIQKFIVWDEYPELFTQHTVKVKTPWLNVESDDPSDKAIRGVMLNPDTKVIPVGVVIDSFDVLCYKTFICLGPNKVEENYAEIPVSLFRNGTIEVQ